MRYLGNKESISSFIKEQMIDIAHIKTNTILFDAFCGTGSIANAFKNECNVIINDNLNCAITYAYGRMIASTCNFNNLGFDPFEYLNTTPSTVQGFFYNTYSPGGSSRMYFTKENAARIDFFRSQIESWKRQNSITIDEYKYLLACLLESVSLVSNTAGVYGSFLKKWDSRALKDIKFVKLNDNITPLSTITTYTEKLENIVSNVHCDVLYLDPPYTQNQYGTQYHLLETLILDDSPSVSKVTGSRSTKEMRSDWSKIYKVHILLDKVLAKTTAKHIFLSYNNAGDMSKEYIESIMKRYGKEGTFKCIKIPYKKYENWKSNNKKEHFEYLFYIEKKNEEEIYYESPLNYIGSKAKIVQKIKDNICPTDTFIDVFGGGFNVGINSNSNTIIYNDINYIIKDLIESFQHYDTYEYITYVKKFIEKHGLEKGNKETYIAARTYYNNLPAGKKDKRMLFAIILYSFQQQIRFNGNHDFNNPAGIRWFNDCILAKLISFSRVIKEKTIFFISSDYIDLNNIININSQTFLYLDPPYKLTTGTYNDGKRGFKGWDDKLENELFEFIDKMSEKQVPCMLSYVLEHKGIKNISLKNWIKKNNYTTISLGDIIGISGQPRKEILILNYDNTTIRNQE